MLRAPLPEERITPNPNGRANSTAIGIAAAARQARPKRQLVGARVQIIGAQVPDRPVQRAEGHLVRLDHRQLQEAHAGRRSQPMARLVLADPPNRREKRDSE